jgi:hypothetical protein
MGSLDFAVELRRSGLNVDMSNTQVFHIPMELYLKLVTTIGSNLLNAEWELVPNLSALGTTDF